MKNRFGWASAVALAITVGSQVQTMGLTNGLVVISTRTASDALYRQISSSTLYDADDFKGPGAFSPGDAAMAELLQDNGYSTRLVPEWLLNPTAIDPYGTYTGLNPEYFYGGGGGPTKPADTNVLYSAQLVIVSGSGSSFDMPPPNTNGIPIIMGEHSCLGNRTLNGQSSIFMYGPINSTDVQGTTPGDVQFMKVLNAAHPIMQGIPLDSLGRVKIWRDRYPEEIAHLPTGGKPNYVYSWQTVDLDPALATPTFVAPGTTVIGVVASQTNRACFAVMEAGGTLSDTTVTAGPWNGRTTAPSRLVHLFVNERGSGDSRRAFNCLTDLGKVIFIRTCKWAMGETLAPYQPLGLIRVSQVGSQQIKLAWDGTATKNYKILGTQDLSGPADFSNWQTVAQDIAGLNGEVSATLDISGAKQYAFLRVMPVP